MARETGKRGGPDARRALPSIERLLQTADGRALADGRPRGLVVDALREALTAARDSIGRGEAPPGPQAVLADARARLEGMFEPSLRSVINATGVILHTNLGRAPLSRAAIAAMEGVASGYSTLEYDLEVGQRGSRHLHVADLLKRVTGAEDAVVANNNASAVLLALAALASGREVVISRGQLVEIGGGFRIPDVLHQSGARLVEVGTTNRTYVEDYAAALSEDTALLLRVHASNFRQLGFVHTAGIHELVDLARSRALLVVDDLGSGSLLPTEAYGLAHEPTVQESVQAGADLVCFSGDKLLGGPQAGIAVGSSGVVERLRRHPLMRAVRPDKATLAGLGATLAHYLLGEAEREVPVWQMIATPPEDLRRRARRLARAVGTQLASAVPCRAAVGGGSTPAETLPSWGLALRPATVSPQAIAERLRRWGRPIVARIEHDQVLLDLRTVRREEDADVKEAVREALLSA